MRTLRRCGLVIAVAATLMAQAVAVKTFDQPPVLLKQVKPIYSPEALQKGYQGTVILWVTIDLQGVPTDIALASPAGMGLDETSIACVKQWRFKPARNNGEPVPARVRIEVNYRRDGLPNRRLEAEESSRSAHNTAVSLLNGLQVPKDEKRAAEVFRLAADKGYAPSQAMLARMYVRGQGVDRDPAQASAWAMKAAKQNDSAAQTLLGEMYDTGLGVAQSETEAFKWYRKAADHGVDSAQFNVGLSYERGRGITANAKDAVKYYRRAADQGFAQARYQLGVLYVEGRSVDMDLGAAMQWFTLAADSGFGPAVNAKKHLAAKMPPADIDAAERAARTAK